VADDELGRFEAVMGALSKSLSGEPDEQLTGVRCPKCEASTFVRVSELFEDAARRLRDATSEEGDVETVVREGGWPDSEVVERLGPPQRRSALRTVIVVAAPLSVAAFYVYRRFGGTIGQAAIAATLVVTLIVFLTTARRLSDDYYARRNRWNRLFMCRRCGQLVSS
jgi:transcription elongation factor Elf1